MRSLALRHRNLLALAALALFSGAASTPFPQADPTRYLDDIKSLAAPAMEGRGAGTKGIARAERLIERRYKELKLDPAGVHGFAQPFTVTTGARLKSNDHL
jgi:hypothetical protein